MMLIVMMASAVALAMTTTTTASTTLSIPASTLLAVVSRLDSYGQRMGTTGTSVPRSFSLDLRQGMPQFIKLDICEHYIYIYVYIDIEIGGEAVQGSIVNHQSFIFGDIIHHRLFPYSKP